jgi:hypothetical protein
MSAINREWHSLSGCAPQMKARLFLILALGIAISGAFLPSRAQRVGQRSDARGNNLRRDLRKIGKTIVKAVLDKNVEALLALDRVDSRSQDEVSLKNTKSDLYCYIFDSECITWGDGTWRSVYDKFSRAHQLEIKASVSSSRYDRQLYGNLVFYDASAVAAKDLRSAAFPCKEVPANIVSWKFRFENGKWKPVTPLFDSETRGPCPSDVQQPE